jgi:hypothetical protein
MNSGGFPQLLGTSTANSGWRVGGQYISGSTYPMGIVKGGVTSLSTISVSDNEWYMAVGANREDTGEHYLIARPLGGGDLLRTATSNTSTSLAGDGSAGIGIARTDFAGAWSGDIAYAAAGFDWLPESLARTWLASPRPAVGRRRIWAPSASSASLNLTQTANIALTGSASVSGDVQIGTQLNLSQTAAVALSGSAAVSGDIQSLTAALDLTQTAAVALSGSASVSGDVQIGTTFNLAQSASVGLSGSASVSGDLQFGTAFDLAQSGAVGLAGSVSVSGDLQISSEPVVEPSPTGGGGFAWAAPRKQSRYGLLPKPTREQMAERVRKQREALGILPKPVQKRIEAAVKKEARRAEPSLAPLAPLAAEVAQDTGVSLQAVVDAIQSAYDYRRGLVSARIQADAVRQAEQRQAQEEAARVEAEAAQAQWQQRLKVLIAADEELLKQDEQARLAAISAIRKTQQALLALLK